jgi:hypothetical protein
MKCALTLLLALAICILILPDAGAQPKTSIQVLDFHSTHRCATCNAIESQTRAVLHKHFSKELAAGKITFRTVNVDEKDNFAIAEEFEASGTSLFINVFCNDKSEKVNLTEFAFMNVSKSDGSFERGLVDALKKALAKTRS